jgi:hypothetical protein
MAITPLVTFTFHCKTKFEDIRGVFTSVSLRRKDNEMTRRKRDNKANNGQSNTSPT